MASSSAILSLITLADGTLEIILSRAGAVMLGLEVDPYPERYKPIVLTGEQARHAAYYIVEYLRNGVSPELFFDATGIEAATMVHKHPTEPLQRGAVAVPWCPTCHAIVREAGARS